VSIAVAVIIAAMEQPLIEYGGSVFAILREKTPDWLYMQII
jgi:hypothetical protein